MVKVKKPDFRPINPVKDIYTYNWIGKAKGGTRIKGKELLDREEQDDSTPSYRLYSIMKSTCPFGTRPLQIPIPLCARDPKDILPSTKYYALNGLNDNV